MIQKPFYSPVKELKSKFLGTLVYSGFESLADIEEEMLWIINDAKELPREFQGTLVVTFEYYPDDEEMSNEHEDQM